MFLTVVQVEYGGFLLYISVNFEKKNREIFKVPFVHNEQVYVYVYKQIFF